MHEMLKNAGFKLGKWWANEALIIEFAYKVLPTGCVILGQGIDGELVDPFEAPAIENKPVHFCFVPVKFAGNYDLFNTEDGLGRAYTEAWTSGEGTNLIAPNIEAAVESAAVLA